MPHPCPKELEQQNEHSPGVVESGELIVYILVDPLQWENGFLKKSAFSKSQLQAGTLSVCRARYCTVDGAYKNIVAPLLDKDPNNRTLVGALSASCEKIRSILYEDLPTQAICVIDDGKDGFPAHAHMGFSAPSHTTGFWENQRNGKAAVRANLVLVFESNGSPKRLEEVFET